MRKLLALMIALAMALGVSACGNAASRGSDAAAASAASAEASEAEKTEEADAPEAPVAGGWEIDSDDTAVLLPEEVQTAFDSALSQFADSGLIPVAYVASQVVSGTNYMLLCRSTAAPTGYQMVIVYADLNGNAEITNVTDFNIGDYTQNDRSLEAEELAGGWTVPEESEGIPLPAEVQAAFDQATEKFVGNELQPLVYLGDQVVAGTNYAILVRGTLVTAESVSYIQVATVYQDLEGNARITSIYTLDPVEYNQ